MMRFLNFFVVGLLAGLVILYQVQRNRELEKEIRDLRSVAVGLQATRSVTTTPATPEVGTLPSTDRLKQTVLDELANRRTNAITRAIAWTSDAVVGINVVQVQVVRNPYLPSDPLSWMLFDERLWPRTIRQKVQNLGSGFIISSDGCIVTNEHVVRDATEIVVTTTARHKYQARVLGTDPLLDMALLKIDGQDLPNIQLGNSDDLIVGEWVIAIGNPYGLFDVNDQPSVSVGVVSALHRDFQSTMDGRIYTDMIQTDAAINRGNSGGPLVNAYGEAVGVNTLIFSETGGSVGIGFAIPSNRISASIDDLLKGGVNRNFWIGIRAMDVSPVRARLQGLDSTHGAVVTSVEAGSPAAKAGIQMEDIILELNGRPVETAVAANAILRSSDLRVGDKLSVKICRRRKIFDVTMTLAPLPEQKRSSG
jgi:serine protease Do